MTNQRSPRLATEAAMISPVRGARRRYHRRRCGHTIASADTGSPSDAKTDRLSSCPETVDEVIAETADRPLDGDQFLEAD